MDFNAAGFVPEDKLIEGGVGFRGTIFSSFCHELTLVIKTTTNRIFEYGPTAFDFGAC